jgi:cytochrome c-type biogenesis protein CcmF
MAEIGYIALVLSLVASIFAIVAFVLGLRGDRRLLVDSARKGVLTATVLVSVSTLVLLIALIGHNFQIEYVASYTSSDLSLPYLISAFWAGNSGSLLFWAWLVSLSAAAVMFAKRASGKELVPYAAIVIMAIQAFFLILLIFAQNPFHKISPVPVEGVGLNPLLENPGMIFHPPMLLAGYALLAVPFAFAMAALWTRRLGDDWIMAIRRWALFAWLLLGIGNLIGAWWAYVELGWGGYWAWDPVENAGLMPWLVMTAFLHSIMLQRRRGAFKQWSMVLIISAFTLTIFGTFITRSDILTSVHTFGESAVGPFFLVFLILVFLGSLALVFYRRKDLRDEAGIDTLVSREGAFFVNNLLLVGATFLILLGTIFPSLSELVSGARIEVGSSFFNTAVLPVFMVVILLSGVCALVGWKSAEQLGRNLLWPSVISLFIVLVLVLFGVRQWPVLVAFFFLAFAISALVSHGLRDFLARRKKLGTYLGAFLVHLAIAIIAIGVVGSSAYTVKEEAVLAPGESMTIKDYTLTYQGIRGEATTSKMLVIADVLVSKGGKFIGILKPEVQFDPDFVDQETGAPLAFHEVAIHSTLSEDLYVILAGWEPVDSADLAKGYVAGLSVLVNPLVVWLWIGGGVFLFGGLLTFLPGRRKPLN